MGLVQSATKFGIEKMFDKLYEDPAHPYYPYVRRIFKDIDPHVGKIFLSNFFVNAGLYRHHRERIQRSSKDNASKKETPTLKQMLRKTLDRLASGKMDLRPKAHKQPLNRSHK